MRSAFLLAAAASFAAVALASAAPAPAAEPPGLWQGAMHADTPNSLKGATVIDAKALAELIARAHPLLIDVAETEKKPPDMAKDMIWLPTHRSIPGAIWFVGGGFGTPDPVYAAAYQTRVAALTNRDLDKPIVVFCHPHCWGSWNGAKRLVLLGYRHVYWFPGGVEGWQSAGHDTEVVKPDAEWQKALSQKEPAPSKRIRQGQN